MALGGFGRQGLGLRGFGAGGPLTVIRALAVAGQVVRVVFNEEPVHRSPAGGTDALNPSNYLFTVPGGNATAPEPVAVDRDPIVGPEYGVGNGSGPDVANERGIDVHVDRQLVEGVVYNVRVQNVQSASIGAMGTPDNADFAGVTQIEEVKLPARQQDLVDFSTPPARGHYVIDDSGDIAVTTPDEGTRQRVYRRQFTRKNAFRFLLNYGAGPNHKALGSPAELAAWRAEQLRQIAQEPDVAKVAISLSMTALGLVINQTQVKTRRGNFVSANAEVSPVGEVRTL